MSIEKRKYVMTKIEVGDYLLPSNSGQVLWRLNRSEDGTWDVFRFLNPVTQFNLDSLEWGHWECVAQQLQSRAAAIAESMRLR